MIYIDVGCHKGDSIKDFYKILLTEGIKSIGIDPLNKYKKEWGVITEKYGTEFINKAALDYNGETEFSEKEQDIKSSVMKDKINYAEGKLYKVSCFDFSEFVGQLNEEVIIRMDIEGAEYPVLEKMIKDETIKKVNFLGVEWHSQKIMNRYYTECQEKIINALDKLKIKWKDING